MALLFEVHNRPSIGSDTYFEPGRARTCNPVIRSHKVDSEQAVKIDDTFYPNVGFQVDHSARMSSLECPTICLLTPARISELTNGEFPASLTRGVVDSQDEWPTIALVGLWERS